MAETQRQAEVWASLTEGKKGRGCYGRAEGGLENILLVRGAILLSLAGLQLNPGGRT